LAIKEYLPKDIASRERNSKEVHAFYRESMSDFYVGLEKFIEEARVLARFRNHPNIVSVSDFFKENNTAYIVMDYLEGVTFKEYLKHKGGRLTFEEAMRIMTPVLDALREVHSVGMLHRDISPDNIYITRIGQVKLLDFGAARQTMGEASKSLSVILKPGYAPSEQYFSKGKQGPWTDVYAVAATIYAAITGVLPPESLERAEEDTLKAPSMLGVQISVTAEKALLKALAVKGVERWQTMAEFHDGLTTVQQVVFRNPRKTSTQEVAAQNADDTSTSENKIQPLKSKKPYLILGGGFVIICVVVVLFVFSANNTPKIQVGEYIKFGKYYDEPILWRVVHNDDDGDPVLFSDKIIAIKGFDAAGKYHKDSTRADYGSNNYEKSNLRQWLNSTSVTIDWSQNSPSITNMTDKNNSYDKEAGFLSNGNFSSSERKMIKPIIHKVLLAKIDRAQADGGSEIHERNIGKPDVAVWNYDSAFYKNVEDSVFLLSVKQIKEWVYDQRSILGNDYHIGKPTAIVIFKFLFNNDESNSDGNWYYWLNSPNAKYSSGVRTIDSDGEVSSASAYSNNLGIRPALQLDLSEAIFTDEGDGSYENPFVIKSD
jgi:serine/threonine protein kinase